MERKYVRCTELFPKVPYEALDDFCRAWNGWKFDVQVVPPPWGLVPSPVYSALYALGIVKPPTGQPERSYGPKLVIDPGFALDVIVGEFSGDPDQWDVFLRILAELVADYTPEKIGKFRGRKVTNEIEPEVRAMFRRREAMIVDAGGRPFQEELRFRLGLDFCFLKVHWSCSPSDST